MRILATACLFSVLFLGETFDALCQKSTMGSTAILAYGPEHSAGRPARRNDVPAKVVRDFLKNFPAEKAVWYLDAKGFVAIFHTNDMHQMVYYDEKGDWTATVRNYKEKYLPKDVRTMVRKTYFDYAIIHAVEVETMSGTAYLISVLLDNDYKIIRVADDEMEVIRQYTYGK